MLKNKFKKKKKKKIIHSELEYFNNHIKLLINMFI